MLPSVDDANIKGVKTKEASGVDMIISTGGGGSSHCSEEDLQLLRNSKRLLSRNVDFDVRS